MSNFFLGVVGVSASRGSTARLTLEISEVDCTPLLFQKGMPCHLMKEVVVQRGKDQNIQHI
jgi:hypothetical protein